MKTIESAFQKNGLDYKMLGRSDDVGLFELFLESETVGYEVCRIIQHDSFEISTSVTVEAGENISSNEVFGKDGSKAFFANEKDKAEAYFGEFSDEIILKRAKSDPG